VSGFDEATTVLDDPLLRSWPDTAHSEAEERTTFIGQSALGRLLVVVVAEAEQGRMRIVTARRATKRERHDFESKLLG
jgi:uncharacterized protein